jgi:2-methylcitrate dehydratase PrpD
VLADEEQNHWSTLNNRASAARYDDALIRDAAANLIDIQPDEGLKGVESTVAFELKNGTKINKRCEFPRGSAENPLTRPQIETKMRTYAQKRLPSTAVDQIIAAVNNLDGVESVRELMKLMKVS